MVESLTIAAAVAIANLYKYRGAGVMNSWRRRRVAVVTDQGERRCSNCLQEVGHAPGVRGAAGWCSRRGYHSEAGRGVGHKKFCRKRTMDFLGLPRSRRRGNA